LFVYLYILDHFAYGHKYTSPQSQRKIIPDEITSFPQHKRLLADDFLVTPEHKKTDIIAKKFELPLDDFGELKNVCTNVRKFFIT